MHAVQYWRSSKEWQKWLGKVGQVLAVTQVTVSSPELSGVVPYGYALVDFGDVKHSWMVSDGETVSIGDTVKCMLKKYGSDGEKGLIEYGIKVSKVEAAVPKK
jgi:uncharacterized OB-fold protein